MTNHCSRCGSTSFRADRSLGGRLVCSHCGTPAEQRVRSVRRSSLAPRRKGIKVWVILALMALVLVLVVQSL